MTDEIEVRIMELEPIRVASFHGFGEHPEDLAWKTMFDWARPRGLLEPPGKHRIFGFNNPDPSPRSPNYGYEFWIQVGGAEVPDGGAAVKEFAGGRYAVTRVHVSTGEEIGEGWQKLVRWLADSPYDHGHHQWLEEHIGPATESGGLEGLTLDLCLPIAG